MQGRANRHHVVIGDGLTAAEFAKNTFILPGERLTIIGPNVEALGRGLAYSKVDSDYVWHLAYLLNSPSENVDPGFARWLRDNWRHVVARMKGKHPDWLAVGAAYISTGDYGALNAPRELYGDYLCSLVDQSLDALAAQGVVIERIAACATGIEYNGTEQTFFVSLDTGETLIASHVDIATGGAQIQPLFDADGQYSFTQLYGNEAAIAARVRQGGAVVCLGSNAAMLDTLRLTQSVLPHAALDFLVVSPSAQLPEPLIPSQPRKQARVVLKPHYASAKDLSIALSTQMAELHQQGYRMADMRGSFKAALLNAGLESLLTDSREARKVLGLTERLFLRGTRDSLVDFQSLRANGQVQLMAGELIDIKTELDALSLTIRHGNGMEESVSATALINCAGAGRAPRFDGMTTILLEKSWLKRCAVSGGLEVGSGLNIGPKGLRYLSPAVTVMGDKALSFSLYDAAELRALVKAS